MCARLVVGKYLGGEIQLADLVFFPVPSNSHFRVRLLWIFLEGGLVWHQLFHHGLKKAILTLLNIRVIILNTNFLICWKETYPQELPLSAVQCENVPFFLPKGLLCRLFYSSSNCF